MARGTLEICSVVSAEQTSPGASSQAGALLCGNARKINPWCVWGGGLLPGEKPRRTALHRQGIRTN